ncbi:hypothetical protein Taro_025969, partial [Colocasia esculenta]|nr:hypothetical protein [Colocasia esculenta]
LAERPRFWSNVPVDIALQSNKVLCVSKTRAPPETLRGKKGRAPMASLSFGSVPLRPSRPRKTSELSCPDGGLKPIVVRGDPPTFVSAPGRRIVAVGDLHGDLAQTRCALETAGVLSSDGQDLWTGGGTVLIQLGDVLDRGEDEIAILSLLRSLDVQANREGGAVFQVNGNHETMNVEGDFRYVDPGAFEECADFLEYLDDHGNGWEQAFISWISTSERMKENRRMSKSNWGPWKLLKVTSIGVQILGQRQKGVLARSTLLRPGGPLAWELARHPVILKVNNWVFCHGGVLPHHVAYGIEQLNKEVSCWMKGLGEDSDDPEIPFIATRGYDSVICSIAEEMLESLEANGIVVGHTPQHNGANSKCDNKVWCIDVGMSSGVFSSRPEVLEIIDDRAKVLRSQTDFFTGLEVTGYL